MKNKNKNLHEYIIVDIFVALIFGPGLAWFVVGPLLGDSDTENRALAEKPEFNISKIESYPKDFEGYLNDHAPFRKYISEGWANLNYRIFKDSTSSSVVVGNMDEGAEKVWLFYNGENGNSPISSVQGLLKFTDQEKEEMINSIKTNTKTAKNNGIKYYTLIVPDKENIYREFLPDKIKIYSEQGRVEELMNDVQELGIDNTIFVKYEILKAKNSGTSQLYYRHDTHWNERGASIGYKALMKMVEPKLSLNYYAVSEYDTDDKRMDLAMLLNIQNYFKDKSEKIKYFDDIDCSSKKIEYGHHGVNMLSNSSAPIKKTVLLIGDSFRTALKPYFNQTFSKVIIYHLDDYITGEFKKYDPDVIIHVTAERSSEKTLNYRL